MEAREKISWLRELVDIAYGNQRVCSSVSIKQDFGRQIASISITLEFPATDKTVDEFTKEQLNLFNNLLTPISIETKYIDMIRLVKIDFVGIHSVDETLKQLHSLFRDRFDNAFDKDLAAVLSEQS